MHVINSKTLKSSSISKCLGSLLSVLKVLGLWCRSTVEVVASHEGSISSFDANLWMHVINSKTLKSSSISKCLGSLLSVLKVLGLWCRSTVEVVAAEGLGAHLDRCLWVEEGSRKILEGASISKDATAFGQLILFVLVLFVFEIRLFRITLGLFLRNFGLDEDGFLIFRKDCGMAYDDGSFILNRLFVSSLLVLGGFVLWDESSHAEQSLLFLLLNGFGCRFGVRGLIRSHFECCLVALGLRG